MIHCVTFQKILFIFFNKEERFFACIEVIGILYFVERIAVSPGQFQNAITQGHFQTIFLHLVHHSEGWWFDFFRWYWWYFKSVVCVIWKFTFDMRTLFLKRRIIQHDVIDPRFAMKRKLPQTLNYFVDINSHTMTDHYSGFSTQHKSFAFY